MISCTPADAKSFLDPKTFLDAFRIASLRTKPPLSPGSMFALALSGNSQLRGRIVIQGARRAHLEA